MSSEPLKDPVLKKNGSKDEYSYINTYIPVHTHLLYLGDFFFYWPMARTTAMENMTYGGLEEDEGHCKM